MTSTRRETRLTSKGFSRTGKSDELVYFLRFTDKLGGDKHHAQYYIGTAVEWRLLERIEEHRMGRGAKITAAAAERGFGIELLMTVPGDRDAERRFKNNGHYEAAIRSLMNGTSRYPHKPTIYQTIDPIAQS